VTAVPKAFLVKLLAPPSLFALAMGLLVAYDARLSPYHPLWQLTLDYGIVQNYLWTGTTLTAALLLMLVAIYRSWLFQHRYQIAVFLLLVSPAIGGLNLGRVDPADIAVLLASLFWLSAVFVEDLPTPVPRVVIALLLALVICALGALMTVGAGIILSLSSIFSKLMVLFLLANLIATPHDHDVALKALIVIAVVSALIAALILAVYFLTGYAFSLDDRTDEQFKCLGWICLLRATALTPTPQLLGHLLIMGLGLALFLRVRIWLHLLIIGVLVLGGILTVSVGVMLSMGIVLVIFPIYRWPSYYLRILIAYATVAWLTLTTGLGAWVYDVATDVLLASYGVDIRVWTYRVGAELLDRSPVFGIGVLQQIPGSMTFTTPHNVYLQIALQLGLPAAGLFIGLLIYLFASSWLIAARAPDLSTRHWMRGLMLGFSGMIVHFTSEPLYTSNLPWAYMGLVTAAIIVYGRVDYTRERGLIGRFAPDPRRLARDLRNTARQP